MYSRLRRSSHSLKSLSRPRLVLIAASVFLALLLIVKGGSFLVWGARFAYRTFEFVSVADQACDDAPKGGAGSPPIPNLVHYVWLLQDPAELHLSFKFFISVYSAHILWRPERIYLHTDATADAIARARSTGTPWTKRILAIPGLELNHVVPLETTQKGVEIKWMPHKADFIRLEALRKYGGIYLDADAIPLRDIADLRNSGFRSVVGQQLGLAVWANNYINNGVMMTVPNSNLMTFFYHSAHEFFDGGWDTAGIRLLTDLANRLSSIPNEVLILQPQAFSPVSWQDDDQRRLFLPSLPSASSDARREQTLRDGAVASGACRDVLAWLKYREGNGPPTAGAWKLGGAWELDFSSSYVLHAFDSALTKVLGKGGEIDLQYVLARESNYARAVFPAVWKAVEEGIIPREEII
ncbi:Lactosylceramide 4-alpha-galactosyltransferase [Chaetomidium leptoderma]|uniref:Lactosylceramide 4-alpha-galactosyltransferase n=1 Tax=Chaetomidium leptoderma TaxID=669021 RepID=A0AAN6VJM4_9PEZI|nr:Lactosylceramide 4-alpha-galactosyltransferase [Chaetomidium leptoderma]